MQHNEKIRQSAKKSNIKRHHFRNECNIVICFDLISSHLLLWRITRHVFEGYDSKSGTLMIDVLFVPQTNPATPFAVVTTYSIYVVVVNLVVLYTP